MRILFVTATRIGDAILSTGLLGHLIDRHPDARITVACGAPAAPILAAAPNLESLIVLRKRRCHAHWLSLWAGCVGRRWDIVVDLRGSAISWLLPARRRYAAIKRDDSIHRVTWLGRILDIPEPPAPRIWVRDADRNEAAAQLPADRPVLSIAPTANWTGKQWPADRFAELAMRLTSPGGILPGAAIAVHGAPSERDQVASVLDAIPRDRLVDMVGASLPVAYEGFRRSSFYVGNDSGLTHLAAASGTPTLALFGPTNDVNYAPWGEKTAFVRTPESYRDIVTAPGFDYAAPGTPMNSLTTDAAESAAMALWRRVAGGARPPGAD